VSGERAWLGFSARSVPGVATAAALRRRCARRERQPAVSLLGPGQGGLRHVQGNWGGATTHRMARHPEQALGATHRRCGGHAQGFVPQFYLLNADNAAGYANKNPEPARVGDVDPARKLVFVVHGILGTGRNWVPFTRKLISKFPEWQFVLVDQRGHGESRVRSMDGSALATSGHTVDACAQDLVNLCHALGRWPEVVIGHSFGGKVALHYHMLTPTPPRQTWVLDSHLGTFDIDNLLKGDPTDPQSSGCKEVNMNMKPGTETESAPVRARRPAQVARGVWCVVL